MPLFNPVPKTSPLLGSRVVTFGHSYQTAGGVTHADRQYLTLLGGLWRTYLLDEGVGGSQIAADESWLPLETAGGTGGHGGWAYCLQSSTPFRGSSPYTPASWFTIVHTGLNDIQQHAHDATGNPRTIFKTGLRTVLSRLASARIFEDTDGSVAYGGLTWQVAKTDTNKNSGSQYRPIPGNNATVTITLPADLEAGYVALGFTVWPASDGTITLSGTAANATGATSLAGLAYAAGNTGGRRNSSNGHVIRVAVTAADATKTIIATYTAGAGTAFATPAAPNAITQGGTPASTTYTYARVYRTYNGDTVLGSTTTTNTGPVTLSGVNFNTVPIGPAWPSGVEAELVIRTAGGTQQGVVQILTTGPAAINDVNPNVAISGYSAPSANPLTGGAAFDYWQIEGSNPVARGAVVNINRIPNAGYSNSAVDADVANYNTDIQSVIAEFATNQWLYVDMDTALNKTASLFASDNVHPNDRGHAIVAQTIHNAVLAWQNTWAVSDIAHHSRVMKAVTSRNVVSRRYNFASLTAGQDYTITTTPGLVDSVNLIGGIDAQIGDDLEVVISGAVNGAVTAQFDVCTLTSGGAALNFFATGNTTVGAIYHPALYSVSSASIQPLVGTLTYTVQAADVITAFSVPGLVYVGLYAKTNSGTKTLFGGAGTTSPPFYMTIKNVANRNQGFNGS